MKKNIISLKIAILSLTMFLIPIVVFGIDSVTSGYRISSNTNNVMISIWDNSCKKVTNNTSNNYFIPTKTSSEWTYFSTHLPANVTISNCTGGCGAGLYLNGTCVSVPAGYYSPDSDNNYYPCGSNNYYSSGGAGSCTLVSSGYYSTGGTSTTRTGQAIAPLGSYAGGGVSYQCAAGRYGNATGNTTDQCNGACQAGYYCPAGTWYATSNICPAGTWSGSGAGSCTNCPAGTYNPSSGSTSAAACVFCSGAAEGSSTCASACGDGICNNGETTTTCSDDCGCGPVGATRTRYASGTSSCGTYVLSEIQTCQNTGLFDGSYTLVSAPSANTRTGYQTATVACGSSCNGEAQTCLSSGWSGTFANASCSVATCVCAASTTNGYSYSNINYGSSTGTSKSVTNGTCNATANCVSGSVNITNESASCNAGYFDNNSSCADGCESRCGDGVCNNGETTATCGIDCGCSPIGATQVRYAALSSACGTYVASETQTCQATGLFNGTYTLTSPPAATSRNRYAAITSACGTYTYGIETQYCQASGSFNGSYTLTSPPSNTTRTRYYANTSGCGTYSCSSETQTCQSSGSFNGSYSATSCSVNDRYRYAALTSACGTYSFSSEYQTCLNTGSYSGSYSLTSVPSNTTRTMYSSSSVACGSSCSSQTQTCQSTGSFSGSYAYGSCSVGACCTCASTSLVGYSVPAVTCGSSTGVNKTVTGGSCSATINCPAGGTYDLYAVSGDSCNCQAGYQQTAIKTAPPILSCMSCSAGYYCPGNSVVTACPAGTYSNDGASSCSTCPANYYCPGASDKISCGAGSTSPAGSSSSSSCSFNGCLAGSTSGYSYSNINNGSSVSVTKPACYRSSGGSYSATATCSGTTVTISNVSGPSCNSGYQYTYGTWYQSTYGCYDVCVISTCSGGSISGYSYSSMSHAQIANPTKTITGGSCTGNIKCSDGGVILQSETCTCNAGYYWNGSSCTICSSGYSSAGATSCTSCPYGTVSGAGGTSINSCSCYSGISGSNYNQYYNCNGNISDGCEVGKSCTNGNVGCPASTQVVCGSCGDGYCASIFVGGSESASSCYNDCGRCGDGICTSGYENCSSCYSDCGGCSCGDNGDCYNSSYNNGICVDGGYSGGYCSGFTAHCVGAYEYDRDSCDRWGSWVVDTYGTCQCY